MDDQGVRIRIEANVETEKGTQKAANDVKKMAGEAEQALNKFQDRLRAISLERERAFSGIGDQLKDLQKKLVSAQAAGDPTQAGQLQSQMVDLVRPVVEQQREALRTLMKDQSLSAKEREQVERNLFTVEQELRNAEVVAHRVAEQQKVGETRKAETEKTKAAKEQVEARQALEQNLQQNLQGIIAARERSVAGLGDQLKNLQTKLASAQISGDPAQMGQVQQQMIALVRPAIEQQRQALRTLLEDQKLTAEQRIQVERHLFAVEQEIRNSDVSAHRAAEQQKLAETRKAEAAKTELTKTQAGARQAAERTLQAITMAGVAAGASLIAMTSKVGEATDAFVRFKNAGLGLDTVAQRMNISTTAVNNLLNELTADGLMGIQDAATSLKNLLSSGFGLNEARNLMLAFKDAAAFGRQGSLDFGEAIRSATEGIKNGNSILVDNAGITKNLSNILEEAGYKATDLNKATTDASIRMALYNGILKEAGVFQGDASKLAGELSGTISRASVEADKAKAAFGQAMAPAVAEAKDTMAQLLVVSREWLTTNPEVARGLTVTAASFMSVASAAGALSGAFLALRAAAAALGGPVAWVITGLTVIGSAVLASVVNAEVAERAHLDQAKAVAELSKQYEAANRVLADSSASTQAKTKAQEDLGSTIAKLGELMPEIVTKWDAEGRAIELNTQKLKANTEAAKDNIRSKNVDALREAQDEADRLIRERDSLQKQIALAKQPMSNALRGLANAPQGDMSFSLGDVGNGMFTKAPEEFERELAAVEAKIAKNTGTIGRLLNMVFPGNDDYSGPITTTPTPTSSPPPGDKMSAALRAALEDLQDLQALDKTPDNLRRTLARVREILSQHGAELKKLEKDRDLIRLRDIALPKEITQAEYTEIMRKLQTDEQMAQAQGKPLDPAVIRDRLKAIKAQFADYLTANPDAGAALDVRLAGLDPEEIRQKVQRALDTIEGKKKLMGKSYTPDDERRDLAAVLPVAYGLPGAEGFKQVDDLIERVRHLDEAMQQANFDRKIKAIASAWEQAQVAAEPQLAALEKQLISEEARGDKASPAVIQSLKTRMQAALAPALAAQRDALDAMLKNDKLTDEQRAQAERELNSVKKTLYSKDVDAHRIASEAKTAVERKAADEREKIQAKALKALDKAERELMEATKARHKTEQDALEATIRDKERELQLYERQLAAEDRLEKINKAKKRIYDLEKTGEREAVLLENGTWEVRIKGMEEAQDALTKAEKEDAEARRKEQLQDEVRDLRLKLDNLKEAHAKEEQEISRHFRDAKEILTDGFEKLKTAQSDKIGEMVKDLQSKTGDLLKPWQSYVTEVQKLLNSIAAPAAPSLPAAPEQKPAGSAQTIGAAAIANALGLSGTAIPAPSMPALPAAAAAPAGAGGVVVGDVSVQVSVQGAAAQSPQAIGAAVAQGVQKGLNEAAFMRGVARGRIV